MDIKLWYALNSNEKVVRIADAKKDENYFCPCCGAEVLPRALNSTKVRPHFYHKKGESCSEEDIHKWVKNDLFSVGQTIKVNTCEGIKEYVIEEILIEKTHKTSIGDYRPDITLITEDGCRIFVEIYNTNKKSIKKYYDKWFELRSTVIELKVEDIIDSEFNLGILEPIYEDNDKFRNFDDNDYRILFGTENKKLRKDLECIYNILYDFAHYKIFIDDVLHLLYIDFSNRYNPSELYKLIDKYVCKYAKDIFFGDYEKYSGLILESLNKEFGTNFDINPLKSKEIRIAYDNGDSSFVLSDDYIDIVSLHRYNNFINKIEEKISKDEECNNIKKELDNIKTFDSKIIANNETIDKIKRINKGLNEEQLNLLIKPIQDINNNYLQRIKNQELLKNRLYMLVNDYYTDENDYEIKEIIEQFRNIFKDDNAEIDSLCVESFYRNRAMCYCSSSFIFRNIQDYANKIMYFV